jgi:hypothetical protein
MIHNDETEENIYFQSPYYWAPFTLIGNWLWAEQGHRFAPSAPVMD